MSLENLFTQSRYNVQLRQQFIDELRKEHKNEPYVHNVTYLHHSLLEKEKVTLMVTNRPYLTYFCIKNQTVNINIFPSSFDWIVHSSIEDFKSTLFDHEYFHAKEMCYTPTKILDPRFLLPISKKVAKKYLDSELRAIQNQINCFVKRDCSQEYKILINNKRKQLNSIKRDIIK